MAMDQLSVIVILLPPEVLAMVLNDGEISETVLTTVGGHSRWEMCRRSWRNSESKRQLY